MWQSTSIISCNRKFPAPQTVIQGWVLLSESTLKSQHFQVASIPSASKQFWLWSINVLRELGVETPSLWLFNLMPFAVHWPHVKSILIIIPVTWVSLFSVIVFSFAQTPPPHPKCHQMSFIQLTAFFPFIFFLPCPPLSPYSHLPSHHSSFLEKERVSMLKNHYFLYSDFRSLVGFNKIIMVVHTGLVFWCAK